MFIVYLVCECLDRVDENGYGNCLPDQDGNTGCYVIQPSSCTDLTEDVPNELWSYTACSEQGNLCLEHLDIVQKVLSLCAIDNTSTMLSIF